MSFVPLLLVWIGIAVVVAVITAVVGFLMD